MVVILLNQNLLLLIGFIDIIACFVTIILLFARSTTPNGPDEKLKRLRKNLVSIKRNKVENLSCKVCRLPIKEDQILVQCPKCRNYFHKYHLFQWFQVKIACPVCCYDFKLESDKFYTND